jgi:alkylated DNA repair dioxygenase AlkB
LLPFEADHRWPEGFDYRADFLTAHEERTLAEVIAHQVDFRHFVMRGVTAKRRVAFFGASYDDGDAAVEIPAFLLPIRSRLAAWAGIDEGAFVMALINEYTPGAAIGWHRDAPQYGIIAGVSLLSACRMKLRPYVTPKALAGRRSDRSTVRKTTHEVELAPRSAYLITGLARRGYEHSIPPATSTRYSITFRTRATPARGDARGS